MNKFFCYRLFGAMMAMVMLLPCVNVARAETPSVLVETAAVEEQSVEEALTAYGVLEPDPDQVISLSLPHAGLINRVWVRLGQRVEVGAPLLEIITAPEARMQFLQAKSALDYAQRELDRTKRLVEEQLATTAQLDATKKRLQDARATLNALKQRSQGVEKETLRSPMDGIITRLDLAQGQRVQADTTAMLIAAEQRLIARLGIEPEDLARVRPGTPLIVSPVFVPGISISTKVREVHAMIDPKTRLVEILAPIPEQKSGQLVLGSRVIGRLHLITRKSMVVPRSAVLTDKGRAYVYVVEAGKARRVSVTEFIDDGEHIAIDGPLTPGDKVVISGNYELTDGMAVRERP